MPTRYLKPGICDSECIDRCSPIAETLFYRLLVNVDDYGRLDARPAVVRSRCFPLKDDMTNAKTQELLYELHNNGLILIYEISGASFIQIMKWDNVPRAQTSKYPAPSNELRHPKEMLEIISEEDLESMICDSITSSGEFAGIKAHSYDRQVRKDQSYFDIVIDTDEGQLGIELKRTRISKSAVEQVVRYKKISGIPFVLIGAGIGVGVDLSDCENNDITVAIYDENFNARVISKCSVIQRDFTLRAVAPLTGTGTGTGTVNRKPEPQTGTEFQGGLKIVPHLEQKIKIPKVKKDIPDSHETWQAYSDAYEVRYGAKPVRNATVNSQLTNFIKRIGLEESPFVAAFYVNHNNQFYVQKMHTVGLLLADAEKLRTEWATNRQVTSTQARQVDKTQTRGNVFNKLIMEARKNEDK